MPQLDVVGLIVADLRRSADFYARLGIVFPAELDPHGHGHVEAALPGGLRFTLDTEASIRSFDPDWVAPTEGQRVGMAFHCGSPEEVDRVYGELIGAGGSGHREPWDAFWGQRYAQVRDPDGAIVDLFAPRG